MTNLKTMDQRIPASSRPRQRVAAGFRLDGGWVFKRAALVKYYDDEGSWPGTKCEYENIDGRKATVFNGNEFTDPELKELLQARTERCSPKMHSLVYETGIKIFSIMILTMGRCLKKILYLRKSNH